MRLVEIDKFIEKKNKARSQSDTSGEGDERNIREQESSPKNMLEISSEKWNRIHKEWNKWRLKNFVQKTNNFHKNLEEMELDEKVEKNSRKPGKNN